MFISFFSGSDKIFLNCATVRKQIFIFYTMCPDSLHVDSWSYHYMTWRANNNSHCRRNDIFVPSVWPTGNSRLCVCVYIYIYILHCTCFNVSVIFKAHSWTCNNLISRKSNIPLQKLISLFMRGNWFNKTAYCCWFCFHFGDGGGTWCVMHNIT